MEIVIVIVIGISTIMGMIAILAKQTLAPWHFNRIYRLRY